jgi:hypothetical protein
VEDPVGNLGKLEIDILEHLGYYSVDINSSTCLFEKAGLKNETVCSCTAHWRSTSGAFPSRHHTFRWD